MRNAVFLFLIVLVSCQDKVKQQRNSGAIFGTTYSIIYDSTRNYQSEFDLIFRDINQSMSTYIPNSIISKVNSNETTKIDSQFKTVFQTSKLIHKTTNGRFDPTIGAVVNAWDFGPEGKVEQLDSLKINSLMQSVGLDKVSINGLNINKPEATKIDFNAIAKGYGVDRIANFLKRSGVDNFLVEIGGEIICGGINSIKTAPWKIGVQNPNLESEVPYIDTVVLNNEAMATSGTYRKYKIDENGRKYTHIIDTESGYPSRTNILSVSVVAKSCIIADAYATALQTMKVEDFSGFLSVHPELRVYIIFEDENKELAFKSFNGF